MLPATLTPRRALAHGWPAGRALFLVVLLLGQGAAHACELRVRRHPDPLVMARMPDGELSGPQFETVKVALGRMGCRVKPMDLPWARALSDLQTGALDVLAGAHQRPEREAFAHFSKSAWPSRNRLFMRRDDAERLATTPLDAMRQPRLRLGLQTGVSYGNRVERLVNDGTVEVVRATSRQGLWQMLARGRIDAVAADEFSSLRELRQLGLDRQLVASGVDLGEEPSHTAFSRLTVSEDFVARFDQTLRAMQRDGSLDAIERRFRELLSAPPR